MRDRVALLTICAPLRSAGWIFACCRSIGRSPADLEQISGPDVRRVGSYGRGASLRRPSAIVSTRSRCRTTSGLWVATMTAVPASAALRSAENTRSADAVSWCAVGSSASSTLVGTAERARDRRPLLLPHRGLPRVPRSQLADPEDPIRSSIVVRPLLERAGEPSGVLDVLLDRELLHQPELLRDRRDGRPRGRRGVDAARAIGPRPRSAAPTPRSRSGGWSSPSRTARRARRAPRAAPRSSRPRARARRRRRGGGTPW